MFVEISMIEGIALTVVAVAIVLLWWFFVREKNPEADSDILEGLEVVTPQEVQKIIRDYNKVAASLRRLEKKIAYTEKTIEKTKLHKQGQVKLQKLMQPPQPKP